MSTRLLAEIFWAADRSLAVWAILLGLAVWIYAVTKNLLDQRRNSALLKIKRNIHALAGSKKPYVCAGVNITDAKEFLDITMNRDTVLFSDEERAYIKGCFADSGNLGRIRRIASRSHRKWRRIEAMLSLGYAQDTGSIPILEGALLSKDDDILYFSILSLASIRSRDAAGVLLGFMNVNNVYTQTILSMLENFGSEVDDDIVGLLSSEDPRTRYMAVRLVAARNMRYACGDVKRLVLDPSADVRSAACDCIGRLGDSTAKDEIVGRLDDDAWFVRMNAVRALSRISAGDAIPKIILLLSDPALLVKESVKAAVANNIEAAIPYIGNILETGDILSKQEMIEALEASGYLKKLLDAIAYKEPGESVKAFGLLKSMLEASVRFGVGSAAERYDRSGRTRILNAVRRINPELSARIEKNWLEKGVAIG